MNGDVYRLLALCARAECDAVYYQKIAQAAAELEGWDEILAQLKDHRMAPLLYVHLKGAGVELPLDVKRPLQSMYVRHRWADQVRRRVLREILAAFQADEIPALVLKGAALSHLVYPESGLRPMSDLDILVPRSEVWRAGQALAKLGFDVPLPLDQKLHHHHLPIATRRDEGLLVAVELHHRLTSDYFDHARAYLRAALASVSGYSTSEEAVGQELVSSNLSGKRGAGWDGSWLALDPLAFSLDGLTIHTLGYEDMLGHVCQHLISHVNVWDYARLIWMADLVSLAERFASEIDWARVRRSTPAVLDTLSLLHFSTPLSDELLSQAPIKIGRAPRGIGLDYQGWPRVRGTLWRKRGFRRVLRDTLFPSEWWLRLRYGLGSTRPLFCYRWVRHPLHILAQLIRSWLEWLGWPSPLDLVKGGTS
jgi:hypothetical protein